MPIRQGHEPTQLSFAPLSQSISMHLVMNGPSAAQPGDRLSISSRFQARGGHWLLVQAESTLQTQEVTIRWITCRYEGVYVALAPVYMIFDPTDVAVIEHTLAEVVNGNSLRLLTEQEVPTVLSHIRVEIVGRRILSKEQQATILKQEIERMVGPFEESQFD